MARATGIDLNSPTQLISTLEFNRDYCSDHFGRFFQNNYSQLSDDENKFDIPDKFFRKSENENFAICVILNNHIVDLKYFSDIFLDWSIQVKNQKAPVENKIDKINAFIDDQRLLPIIKSFKKINDEIVIGRCIDRQFVAFD